MSKQKWSTEKPTKTGYYWVMTHDGERWVIELLMTYDKELRAMRAGFGGYSWGLDHFTHFIGPFHPPTSP